MKYKVMIICISIVVLFILGAFFTIRKFFVIDSSKSAMSNNKGYTSISMDEAAEIFKTPGDYIILDVRRADEFANGHIPGAINVANEDIGNVRPVELPDLNQRIYVYCRSGRRSKEASAKLAALGYSDICECGGIIDWKGEKE